MSPYPLPRPPIASPSGSSSRRIHTARIGATRRVRWLCSPTMHLLGQSTIVTLSNDRATGEVYCMPHHLTVDGTKRSLMIAALRYADTYVKQDGVWLYAERRLYVDWIEERPLSWP